MSVQVFTASEVEDAAAKVFLMRRRGSVSRRNSSDSTINKATRRASTDSSIPTRRASTDSSIASSANTEEETARKELIRKVVSNTNTTNLSFSYFMGLFILIFFLVEMMNVQISRRKVYTRGLILARASKKAKKI